MLVQLVLKHAAQRTSPRVKWTSGGDPSRDPSREIGDPSKETRAAGLRDKLSGSNNLILHVLCWLITNNLRIG